MSAREKRQLFGAIFIGTLIFASCAPASERTSANTSDPNAGPFLRSINGWNHVDRDTLVVYSGRQPWRVDVIGNCSDLPFANTVTTESRGGDLKLTSGSISRIYVDGRPCGVTHVEQLPKDFSIRALREQENAERREKRESRTE